jgi:hypothetical protein
MNLTALPDFSEYTIWMLDDARAAIVIDPRASAPVESACDACALALAGILVTHHPAERVGGIDAPCQRLRDTLFCGGCGRLFGGPPADMLATLRQWENPFR